MAQVSVLFVCLGNICRSPTAEAVFSHQLEKAGLKERVAVDSAGTGDWHVGKAPDPRAQAAANGRGYGMDHLRARQVTPEDFRRFDYVLAMDAQNLSDLKAMQPRDSRARTAAFLDFHPGEHPDEVPDPYYGAERGFDEVLDLVEGAAEGLLEHLRREYHLDRD